MSSRTQSSVRMDFRLEHSKKSLIEQAAAARGMSLTDFAVSILYKEAREVLVQDQNLKLSDRDRDQFLAALDRPPKANKALRAAVARYRSAKKRGDLR